ncbi:MAG: hypothetical protein U0174_04080 [Polyangiaceae bacterium]
MELVVSIVVSSACAVVALRRLFGVLGFPSFDLRALLAELKEKPSAVVALLRARGAGTWEHLCAEGYRQKGDAAAATLNEALLELEHGLSKGARVPRVTASVASSVGFLLASLVIRRGLTSAAEEPTPVFDGLIVVALNVVCVGVAGAVTCATAGTIANRIAKARWKEGEGLIDALRHPEAAAEAGFVEGGSASGPASSSTATPDGDPDPT